MRVLITGGAGFLGSHIAEHLIQAGADVLLIDNFATGRRDNLLNLPRGILVEGSLADSRLVDDCFSSFRPTHVVHAAASFKDPDNWVEDIQTNIIGTVNVIKASQRSKVDRLVHFQTALAYGRAISPIGVDSPFAPLLSYSISKAAADYFVMMSGIEWVSLRIANVYGPRLFTGPQPIFFKRLRDGARCTLVNTRRDFIALEDFLALLEKVLPKGAPVGAFNVASGFDVSIPSLFNMIAESMSLTADQYPVPIVQEPSGEDLSSLLLDASKTFEVFDWRPKISVEAGTRALVDWYKKHGVGETYTHFVAQKLT